MHPRPHLQGFDCFASCTILEGSADTDRDALLAFNMTSEFLRKHPSWGSSSKLDCWAPGCIEVNDEGRVVGLTLVGGAVKGEKRLSVLAISPVFFEESLGSRLHRYLGKTVTG